MNRSPETPFRGICEGCGSPDGLYQPHNEIIYCPTCAKKQDDYDAAALHLGSLLGPVVTAWYQHWRARGLEANTMPQLVEDLNEPLDIVTALITRENPKVEAAIIPHTLNRAALSHRLEVAA